MFCTKCGKQIVEGASFCAFCGKSVVQNEPPTQSKVEKWEYTFYQRLWEPGKGGRWNLIAGQTEYDARLDAWGRQATWIKPEVQKYLDNGWQPINTPGPEAYKFVNDSGYASGVKISWVELFCFMVDFRRPALTRTEHEKRLIGRWRWVPQKGKSFLGQIGSALLPDPTAGELYEFNEDLTFRCLDKTGNLQRVGVFSHGADGKLSLIHKWNTNFDATLSLTDNTLIAVRENGTRGYYERVS